MTATIIDFATPRRRSQRSSERLTEQREARLERPKAVARSEGRGALDAFESCWASIPNDRLRRALQVYRRPTSPASFEQATAFVANVARRCADELAIQVIQRDQLAEAIREGRVLTGYGAGKPYASEASRRSNLKRLGARDRTIAVLRWALDELVPWGRAAPDGVPARRSP